MNRHFSYFTGWVMGCVFSTLSVENAMAKSTEERLGDIGQFVPVAAGLTVSLYKDDSEGAKQLARSTIASFAATEALKYSFDNTSWGKRPNGGSESFPSGHTSFACSGSAYLGERYGWEYGVPAFAVAVGVGISRVNADKHHWRDVIAGCGLSYTLNEFFVTKIGEENLYPVIGPEIIGFRLKINW